MSIKKCTSWFLILLILVSNVGMAINVHYCGDSIASVSVSNEYAKIQTKKCCAVAKEDGSCCKSKQIKVEKKAFNAILKAFFFQVAVLDFTDYSNLFSFQELCVSRTKQFLSYYVEANAPPLFKLYCQYIFYA